MQPRRLTSAAPIVRAPAHVRFGRAVRRLGRRAAAGAQALSPAGAMMTIGLEAIVLTPYWDSVHVLTDGIGHTKMAGPPDPATMWQHKLTIGQAIAQFETDTARYAAGVRRAFVRPLSQAQFDAAFDFNYNSGAIEVAQWVNLFNAGRDAEALASFRANWRQPESRRAAEEALFFRGNYAGDGTAALVPANPRGRLDWHGATRIDIRPYFPARAA